MQQGKKLRKALAGKGLVTAPGVYDMISAKIADGLGFSALYMTGYGVSASLGLPDAGLASYTEMVERVAQICQGTTTPVICDADTGFGGLLNVERTVRGYERAGAAAIQIEDQVFPKKCGHTPGRRVVPIDQMVRKIEVAAASRASADFLIVARTDARTNHGLDEALRRGEAYRQGRRRYLVHRKPGERGGDGEDRPALRCATARQHGRRRAHADPAQEAAGRARATGSPSSRPPAFSPPPRRWRTSTACSRTRARATRSAPSSIPSTSSAASSASSTSGSSTSAGPRRDPTRSAARHSSRPASSARPWSRRDRQARPIARGARRGWPRGSGG